MSGKTESALNKEGWERWLEEEHLREDIGRLRKLILSSVRHWGYRPSDDIALTVQDFQDNGLTSEGRLWALADRIEALLPPEDR